MFREKISRENLQEEEPVLAVQAGERVGARERKPVKFQFESYYPALIFDIIQLAGCKYVDFYPAGWIRMDNIIRLLDPQAAT